ncbi:hypothetical protein PR202_ga25487 [Eleusine coracana subsp. coracana]|uniref:Uncharacterized protein n=1 Tax=Eleusine coracana subsp. coracana TaxID=191504 RepID=A0AAV5DBG1_ELECO|nr:hypothetical protein PR202_ga25426 [Eleusine coracana subsp. coracana]GJN07642.1 hypothetical protein PR202_ga25487 [Eleusine coracana subsp. coracana]
MMGQRLEDLCPFITNMVPRRHANRRTVSNAIANMSWIRDIHGTTTLDVIIEFLKLCSLIEKVALQPAVQDTHTWRLSASGNYTTKSAYDAIFMGSIQFEPWERIWQTWAPVNAISSCGWL